MGALTNHFSPNSPKLLAFLTRRFSRCFSMAGGPPLGDRPARVPAQFASPGERYSVSRVPAEIDGLPLAVQPIVEPERDGARRCDAHIHAVTIGHLVHFGFLFQLLECCIDQHFGPPRGKVPSRGFWRPMTSKMFLVQRLRSRKVPSRASFPVTVLLFFRLINEGEVRQRGRQTRFMPADSCR